MVRHCIWELWQPRAASCFPSSSSSLECKSNRNLLLRKYWKAGNKFQKASLACSFIPPPQLSNLEISSKQYELVNVLTFTTKLYRSTLPPTPFAAFFFPCSAFLTWVPQSLCPSQSPFLFLFSVLFFAHAAMCEQTILPVLLWKTCFLLSLEQSSSWILSLLLLYTSSTPFVKKIPLLLMEMVNKRTLH